MRVVKIAVVTALFSGMAVAGFSQKITVLDGDLKVLKGEKFLNVRYDWSEVSVGKFPKEEDYINTKVADYNKDEPGRGDKWKSAWNGDKTGRFQPEFEKLFNEYSDKFGLYMGNEKTAKYTAVVKTTFIEPGFNVFVTKRPANISLHVQIVETDNPDKVVATIVSKDNPGRTFGGSDIDTGVRISESYAFAGKYLAKFFGDKLGK
jgi:hypothetical protein